MMKKKMQEGLCEPFPPGAVRTRPGSYGKQLKYIESWRVVRRLNQVFDADWDLRIKQHVMLDEEVVVEVQLTAAGVTKEAFGASAISRNRETSQPISVGDDIKSACSDGLKKAASLFGVGLELHSGRTASKADAASSASTPRTSNGNGHLTERQAKAILAIAGQRGISEPEVRTKILDSFGVPLERLGRREASELITKLNTGNGRAVGGVA